MKPCFCLVEIQTKPVLLSSTEQLGMNPNEGTNEALSREGGFGDEDPEDE